MTWHQPERIYGVRELTRILTLTPKRAAQLRSGEGPGRAAGAADRAGRDVVRARERVGRRPRALAGRDRGVPAGRRDRSALRCRVEQPRAVAAQAWEL